MSNLFATLNLPFNGVGDSKTPLFFWCNALCSKAWLNFPSATAELI